MSYRNVLCARRVTKVASSIHATTGFCQKHFTKCTQNLTYNLSSRLHTYKTNYAPIQIDMPALSPTMEEGTIVSWVVGEGDELSTGDALCEVETDKAVVTMEAVEDGVLAKILLPAGTKNVKIGTPIAIIAEDGENVEEAAAMVPQTTGSTDSSPATPPTSGEPADSTTTVTLPDKSLRSRISPAVRLLTDQFGIDTSAVKSSGPRDILLKGDVLRYISQNNLKPKEQIALPTSAVTMPTKSKKADTSVKAQKSQKIMQSAYQDYDLTGMRKVIAKRLTESKQSIPHTYASIDCTMNNILKLRKDFIKNDVKVSVNDFIVKAVAKTLQNFPEVNSVWKGDKLVHSETVDVSVAVATDTGLITPIVKKADGKTLSTITSEIRALANKARTGKLKPNEFQGGTFTISNLGMYGIKEFTAVINPPQVCIMAVGGSRIVPVKNEETNEVIAQTVMTVTISSDGRVIDASQAENFLIQFKQNMENPMLMI